MKDFVFLYFLEILLEKILHFIRTVSFLTCFSIDCRKPHSEIPETHLSTAFWSWHYWKIKFKKQYISTTFYNVHFSFFQILLEVTRNVDRISSKTFSYFFKLLSRKLTKIFPIFLKCSPSFSYVFLNYLLDLLNIFSFSKISLKFYLILRIFLLLIPMFIAQFFNILLELIRNYFMSNVKIRHKSLAYAYS